jgi:hypothetical protein
MKVTPHAAPPVIAKVHAPPSERWASGPFSDLLNIAPNADAHVDPAENSMNGALAVDTGKAATIPGTGTVFTQVSDLLNIAPNADAHVDPAENSMNGALAVDTGKAATIPGTGTVFTQGSQAQQSENVFGFNQLGVFGRYGAADAQDQSQTGGNCSPPPVNVPPGLPQTGSPLSGPSASLQGGPDSALQSLDRAGAGDVPSLQAGPHASGAHIISLPGAPAADLATPEAATDILAETNAVEDGIAAPAKGRPSAAAQPNRRSGSASPSLVVSDANGSLSIVARSTDALENYSGLRRRLEDTAAEFGMKVSEFQLNGSPSQSPVSIPGGQHGSRTR